MSGGLGDRLAAWSAMAASGVSAALDAAAEELAADISRQVSASGTTAEDAATVTVSRDGAGQTTVVVTFPDAEAREYGTRAMPARPVLRPAVAALRDGLRPRIATALRNALAGTVNR